MLAKQSLLLFGQRTVQVMEWSVRERRRLSQDSRPAAGESLLYWKPWCFAGLLQGVSFDRLYDGGNLFNYQQCSDAGLHHPVSYSPLDAGRVLLFFRKQDPALAMPCTRFVGYELWRASNFSTEGPEGDGSSGGESGGSGGASGGIGGPGAASG
jgi:hypothetical protein